MITEVTINPQVLAALLLGMRAIAVILIGAVLIRQIHNLRRLHTDYPAVRWTVFALTVVLLIGQLIPIILDAVVTFGHWEIGRHRNLNLLSISYALNNAVKDVVIGALLSFLYFRLATPPRIANNPAMDGKVPQPENTPIPDKISKRL